MTFTGLLLAAPAACDEYRGPRAEPALGGEKLSILKHISHAANGMDQFLFEWIVDLAAQPAYRHIDDVGIAVEIDVPDLLGNQRTG